MGADFVSWAVHIESGRDPDWNAGAQKIEELSRTATGKWPQEYQENQGCDEDPVVEAGRLREDLAEFKSAWEDERRDAGRIRIGNRDALITGGMSWGDSPTILFDSISRLHDSGVLDACGFFQPDRRGTRHYLLFVHGDIEPETLGPFSTEDERDQKALSLRKEHGPDHGIFPAVVYEGGALIVGTYSNAFFEEAANA